MGSRSAKGEPRAWQRIRPSTSPPSTPVLDPQPNVLAQIYELVASNKTDDAMDLLYDVVDDLLSSDSFSLCDRMLTNIELGRMNADLMIGALSITLPAKSSLPARTKFLERVEQELARTLLPGDVVELLRGLR